VLLRMPTTPSPTREPAIPVNCMSLELPLANGNTRIFMMVRQEVNSKGSKWFMDSWGDDDVQLVVRGLAKAFKNYFKITWKEKGKQQTDKN